MQIKAIHLLRGNGETVLPGEEIDSRKLGLSDADVAALVERGAMAVLPKVAKAGKPAKDEGGEG